MADACISRRAVLRATIPTIAGAAALAAFAEAVQTPDPLLAAIAEYRAGNEAFCASPETLTSAEEDAYVEATYGPPMRRLHNWHEPARSLQSVAEVIRLLLDEGPSESYMTEPLLAAALAYLDGIGEVA